MKQGNGRLGVSEKSRRWGRGGVSEARWGGGGGLVGAQGGEGLEEYREGRLWRSTERGGVEEDREGRG